MERQTSTFVYRHINYRVKNKVVKSLKHSLRIESESFRELEWNKKLTPENSWAYLPSKDKFYLLSNISNEEKEKLVNKIIDNNFVDNVSSEDKNTLSKYKAKIKKKINSLDDHEPLIPILKGVIEENNFDYYESEINKLDGVKRKNQLIGMLNHYRDYYNLCRGATNKNSAKIHEAFFKFPIKNNVSINKEDAAKAIYSFYQKLVPDYPVKLIVIHDDERLQEEDVGIGIHPHIFVSTRNNKTGKLDLLTELKRQVDLKLAMRPVQFIQDSLDDATGELVSEEVSINSLKSSGREYRGTQIFASVLQDMFHEHLQKSFPKLDIHFTEERAHRFGRRANKYLDSQKRKADRTYSLHKRAIEERDQLKAEIETLQEDRSSLIADITKKALNILREALLYIQSIRLNVTPNPDRVQLAILHADLTSEATEDVIASIKNMANEKPAVNPQQLINLMRREPLLSLEVKIK